MMHSESTTRSPSSFSFTRSTPCVEGCCGPMLRMISSAPSTVVSTFEAPDQVPPLFRVSAIFALLPALDSQVFSHPGRVLFQNVVILAQRMTLPLVGQQNAFQIRMTLEHDAEHVEAFALEPVGHRPDSANARHRLAFGCVRLQPQPLILRKRIQIEDHIETLLAP